MPMAQQRIVFQPWRLSPPAADDIEQLDCCCKLLGVFSRAV